MKIVTRAEAIANLKAYIGKDLHALAAQYGISTYETGRQNKDRKDLILGRLAGLTTGASLKPICLRC